ncbi:hypothetical protein P9X10_00885 [Bacillus cereus]|nr:hypothetical protein [Bacillus cereus]
MKMIEKPFEEVEARVMSNISKEDKGENTMEQVTLNELRENDNWEKAVIVFKQESFSKEFTENQRSYEINRDSHYFKPDSISGSLFGNCLDGTDDGVRLDIYMKRLPEEGKRWLVEYCYITK